MFNFYLRRIVQVGRQAQVRALFVRHPAAARAPAAQLPPAHALTRYKELQETALPRTYCLYPYSTGTSRTRRSRA